MVCWRPATDRQTTARVNCELMSDKPPLTFNNDTVVSKLSFDDAPNSVIKTEPIQVINKSCLI